MPVRSRGSLLARTATLAGLLLAGLGCHANTGDRDAFAIPTAPGGSSAAVLSQNHDPATLAAMTNQPLVRYSPAPPAMPAATPVTLQPVPLTQAGSRSREVIASSWQPVQRVSAEQMIAGPDLQSGAPNGGPPSPTINARPVPSWPARMPLGTPIPGGNTTTPVARQAIINSVDAPPGSIVLPQPRPLGSPLPAATVYEGPVGPVHMPYPNVPREFEKMALPPYVVEPPDILLIQASAAVTSILQPLEGQHLVTPDGMVNLGIYGKIRVVGMTLDQVADAVAARLLEHMPGLLRGIRPTPIKDEDGKDKTNKDKDKTPEDLVAQWSGTFRSLDLVKREMQVDVLVYNSKYFYVITDGGGYGQQVYPFVITGNETVLDALAKVNGLPAVANKKRVWVARATRAGQPPKILPVDWMAVTKCGAGGTNYQLFPGDRVYVDSDPWIKTDTWLAKRLSPLLRGFGATLLGASTVNTIKLGTTSGTGLGGVGGIIR